MDIRSTLREAAQPQWALSRWENEGGAVLGDLRLVTAIDAVKAAERQPLRIAPLAGPQGPGSPVAAGSASYG